MGEMDVLPGADLEAWLKEGGAVYHKIRPALVSEGYRGIVATERLSPGNLHV